MLQAIDEEGNTTHVCPGCNKQNAHHISLMTWQRDADLVALPACSCGTQTFCKTRFTAVDLQEPIIHRDQNGKILSVVIPGSPNLWPIISHQEPNPAYTEGGTEPELLTVIDAVVQHPAIARHQTLAQQLYGTQNYPLVQTAGHTGEGVVRWNCPGCRQQQSAHVSHPGLVHVPARGTIALPQCLCGTRVAIKLEQPEPATVTFVLTGPDGQTGMYTGMLAQEARKRDQQQQFLEQLRSIGKLPQAGGKEGV